MAAFGVRVLHFICHVKAYHTLSAPREVRDQGSCTTQAVPRVRGGEAQNPLRANKGRTANFRVERRFGSPRLGPPGSPRGPCRAPALWVLYGYSRAARCPFSMSRSLGTSLFMHFSTPSCAPKASTPSLNAVASDSLDVVWQGSGQHVVDHRPSGYARWPRRL